MMEKTLVVFLVVVQAVCQVPLTTSPPPTLSTSVTSTPTTAAPTDRLIKIGAFNIQSFGKTKYGRLDVRDYLVQIVTQYDAIMIQEIKDVSETMIYKFLADCQLHRNFSMVLSARLGRSRYREQYALFYDHDKLTVNKYAEYPDPQDIFHREPLIVHLMEKTKGKELTLMGVHTDPDDVPEELGEMENAYNWAVGQGYPTNALMMGDFNADCNYFKASEYSSVSLATNSSFTWLIDGSADTTVSDRTDCAYDRFVSTGTGLFSNTTVDRFDLTFHLNVSQAKRISDHYPIRTIWVA
ncbi:hypothetical protein ACHWQZ_G003381 [Mnemiopsis leidyi]